MSALPSTTDINQRRGFSFVPTTVIADAVRGRSVLMVRCPCRSQEIMELEFWLLRLTRHFSSSELRLRNFDSGIYRSLNILIVAALRERRYGAEPKLRKPGVVSRRRN